MPLLLLFLQAAAGSDGLRVEVRDAALFGAAVLRDAREGRPLPDAWRLRVGRPGWFLNARVEPGDYAVSLERGGGDYQFVLRDGRGRALGAGGFWVSAPSEERASAEIAAAGGASLVTIRAGDILVPFRFVPEEAHRAVAKGVEHRAGRVVVVSDVDRPSALAALAREADRAVEEHAALLGRPAPPGPFLLHVFSTEQAYLAAEQLVTAGRFRRHWAMASPLTGRGYVWWVSRQDAPAFLDLEAPMRLRAVLLHELGHLVAYASRPGAVSWPAWLGESLAEEGTRRALGPDGASFEEQARGHWRRAAPPPSLEEFLAPKEGHDLAAWYAAATLFGRRLAGSDGLDLDRLDPECVDSRSAATARTLLGERGPKLWRALGEDLAKGPSPPAPVIGYLDAAPDGWRVSTRPDGQGRVILPDLRLGESGVLQASFSWQPVGGRQADLYLGVTPTSFLKVAILPRRIVLFRFEAERWEEWGARDLERPIETGDGKSRLWHAARVRFGPESAEVEVDGAHVASFSWKREPALAGTGAGFGAYDGVAYFRDVKLDAAGR